MSVDLLHMRLALVVTTDLSELKANISYCSSHIY